MRIPSQQPLAELAVALAKDELERLLADPLDGLDGGAAGSGEAGEAGAGGEIPKSRASSLPQPGCMDASALEGLSRSPGLSFPPRSLHIPLPAWSRAMGH